MQAIINPGKIAGKVTPPPSKSITQRVLAASLLFDGVTEIHNAGFSNDEQVALDIVKENVEVVSHPGGIIEIHSRGIGLIAKHVDCGESGLASRLFIPIAALSDDTIVITGEGSLLHRPMTELRKILPELGVAVVADNNHLPLSVKGPLKIRDITVDGSLSSQFLTGILTVFALRTSEPVTITVSNLKSRPYIDLTIDVLHDFGCEILNRDYEKFTVLPRKHISGKVSITVETDWSAAANYIVANALGGDIHIHKLNYRSSQADASIAQVATTSGNEFDFDATHCPDIIPILSIYAARCSGTSRISGLHRLLYKESNRIASTTDMLARLGVHFTILDDILLIEGTHEFLPCTIEAYNDHRIVMAASIAALFAKGPVIIDGAHAVSKSYPAFFSDLQSMGVNCQLVP